MIWSTFVASSNVPRLKPSPKPDGLSMALRQGREQPHPLLSPTPPARLRVLDTPHASQKLLTNQTELKPALEPHAKDNTTIFNKINTKHKDINMSLRQVVNFTPPAVFSPTQRTLQSSSGKRFSCIRKLRLYKEGLQRHFYSCYFVFISSLTRQDLCGVSRHHDGRTCICLGPASFWLVARGSRAKRGESAACSCWACDSWLELVCRLHSPRPISSKTMDNNT